MNQAKQLKVVHEDQEANRSQTLWKTKENEYFVVSRVPYDGGWETMIFPSDKQGKISDYLELYCSREYETHRESVIKYLVSKYGK